MGPKKSVGSHGGDSGGKKQGTLAGFVKVERRVTEGVGVDGGGGEEGVKGGGWSGDDDPARLRYIVFEGAVCYRHESGEVVKIPCDPCQYCEFGHL